MSGGRESPNQVFGLAGSPKAGQRRCHLEFCRIEFAFAILRLYQDGYIKIVRTPVRKHP